MHKIFYNILPPDLHINCYNQIRYSSNWACTGNSIKGKKGFCFWYQELINNKFYTEDFLDKIQELSGKKFTINRLYANGQTYGTPGDLHIDSQLDFDYTFLYYANIEWNIKWGGATVIYIDDQNYLNITPIPNSGILFKSNYLHAGLEPTRHYPDLRITVAFKLRELI